MDDELAQAVDRMRSASRRTALSSLVFVVVWNAAFFLTQPAISQQTLQTERYRKWTDSTGSHHIVAKLVSRNGRDVRLRKSNGQVITVQLDTLSDTDQRFVLDSERRPTARRLAAVKSDTSQSGSKKDVVSHTGLDGRRGSVRATLVRKHGGTNSSEAAVAAALKWLADHQNPDGSWGFDHRQGPCQGRCPNPGTLDDVFNGATGLALLPFLGAGQTHKEGSYKETVKKGLAYLLRRMKVQGNHGSFLESGGTMYTHGICSIALCEAYAMTHDKGLMAPAQRSINFIAHAQDPVGGGWRYQIRQPGDTSVLGWQLTALKSAHMAYLTVPPGVVQKAGKFLDSVQIERGAKYGYTGPGSGLGTTSVGLLSRMYLGWQQDHVALARGVQFLDQTGPSHSNMYYNYYATQIMRHYEGEPWERWNPKMRDWLVNTQSKNGHTAGSWYVGGDHGAQRGGRLYITAMAAMVLEVYYRHLSENDKTLLEQPTPVTEEKGEPRPKAPPTRSILDDD